jgi:hypothetical protein
MGGVGTSIFGRPRPLSGHRRADPATPSTAKSRTSSRTLRYSASSPEVSDEIRSQARGAAVASFTTTQSPRTN